MLCHYGAGEGESLDRSLLRRYTHSFSNHLEHGGEREPVEAKNDRFSIDLCSPFELVVGC